MKINEKNISYYNMQIQSFTYQPLSINRELFTGDRSLTVITGQWNIKPKEMTLIADFQSMADISLFIADLMLHDENIIDMEDGYIYHCYLKEIEEAVEVPAKNWYTLTVAFKVIQTEPLRHVVFNGKTSVFIGGTWQTSIRFRIVSSLDIASFTIAGHVIKNLKANKEFILDGIDKMITCQGKNCFGDVILANNHFPSLTPGWHDIETNNTKVKVTLEYYPMFV